MNTTVEELAARASSLSADDRARLADLLLASLHDDDEAEADAAWGEEIQRRLRALDDGTAKLVTADEVHAEARKLYR